MTIRVEHELHTRRKGRNLWVGGILVGLVGIVFGLTVVKVTNLGDITQFERFDRVLRPALVAAAEEAQAAEDAAAGGVEVTE